MLFLLVTLAAAPTLSFDERVSVEVGPAYPRALENTSTSSLSWISLEGAVSYSCPSTPLVSIELSGEGPLTKTLAAPMKRTRRSGEILTAIPMWRIDDARAACKRKQKTLPSSPITATVTCEGAQPVTVPFSVPLELSCVSKDSSLKSRLETARRGLTTSLHVGEPGNVKLEVRWSAIKPTPVSATVVELDAAGEVANRFMTVQPGKDDSFDVTLDTSTERRTVLGLELKFDGHTSLKPLLIVFVSVKTADGGLGKLLGKGKTVIDRLWATFPQPCAKPEETVKWIRAQPEVHFAEFHGGLIVNVDGLEIPVNCSAAR